ncbi:MAG: NAD(P)/FAD-dependent oxidoreductase [Terriglobales bacterium]
MAVVGGGPGGCAAAIAAARKGARVLLLERTRFPRHKVCGEFVSAESLELLQSLLANDFHHLLTRAPRICSSRIFLDGSILEARIDPPAASIARFDLDAALWETCCLEGVEAHAETVVKSIEGNGPFRIIAGNQVFAAQALINASGRWSSFTSPEVRARNSREKWIGIKAHFYEDAADPSTDLYFFDGGYCGVQLVTSATNNSGARINACAMVRADVANAFPGVLELHPALRERSRTWKPATEIVSTSPLVFHKPEPVQNTMLQVGDAAAFVDPFIGDGISLALRSGALTAECLHSFFRAERTIQEAAALYSDAYMERLGRVFKVSSMLRGWLRWPRPIRRPIFSLISRAEFIGRQMVKLTR